MKTLGRALALSCIAAFAAGAQTIGCVKPGVYVSGKGATNMRMSFNQMQVDSIFNGVALNGDARSHAESIVDEAKARRPGVAKRDDPLASAVMKSRNEKLVALVPAEKDKEKIRQNLSAMAESPHRCDVSG